MKSNEWIKVGAALVLACVVFRGVPAQNPAPQPAALAREVLPMAEVQQLRIQVRRDALEMWQKDFSEVINNIKRENGWKDDVQYDFTNNSFFRVPQPKAAGAAAGKK